MLPKQWVSTPVIAANRNRDVVHRTLGPGGLVLIGEGEAGRVRQLLNSEVKKHERVAYGIPVSTIVMGDREGQVPLDKLADHIRKMPKVLKPNQVTDVKQRLRALDAVRPPVPLPKARCPQSSPGERRPPGDARPVRPRDGESDQRRRVSSLRTAPGPAAGGDLGLGDGDGRPGGRAQLVAGTCAHPHRPVDRTRAGVGKPGRSIGYLDQDDDIAPGLGARRDRRRFRRPLLGGGTGTRRSSSICLPESIWTSGEYVERGERDGEPRRHRLGDHELLVLDEPTNHLDVEAVAWLAEQLRLLLSRGVAMIVVSHDRWFLDAVCTRIWEVHDGTVDAYDGGYSAYVLTRAEQARQAAGIAAGGGTCCARSWPGCVEGRPPAPRSPSSASTRPTRSSPTSPGPEPDRVAPFRHARLGKDVFDLTTSISALVVVTSAALC